MKSEPDVQHETLSSDAIAMQVELRRAGRRHRVMHGGTLCSRCLACPPLPSHKYCRLCKRAADRQRLARNKAALATIAASCQGKLP